MDDAVLDVRRIGMGRRAVDRLNAAPLVDGDVDDHGARLHRLHHVFGHDMGRSRPGNQHRSDQEIRVTYRPGDIETVGHDRDQSAMQIALEVAQPIEIDVDQGHLRAKAHGHLGGFGADRACAHDDDIDRRDPWYAA